MANQLTTATAPATLLSTLAISRCGTARSQWTSGRQLAIFGSASNSRDTGYMATFLVRLAATVRATTAEWADGARLPDRCVAPSAQSFRPVIGRQIVGRHLLRGIRTADDATRWGGNEAGT